MESLNKAESDIPSSDSPYEVLSLRLDIIHHKQSVDSASAALVTCDIKISEDHETMSCDLVLQYGTVVDGTFKTAPLDAATFDLHISAEEFAQVAGGQQSPMEMSLSPRNLVYVRLFYYLKYKNIVK